MFSVPPRVAFSVGEEDDDPPPPELPHAAVSSASAHAPASPVRRLNVFLKVFMRISFAAATWSWMTVAPRT